MYLTTHARKSILLAALLLMPVLTYAQAIIDNITVEHTNSKLVLSMTLDFSKTHISSEEEIVVTPCLKGAASELSLPKIVVEGRSRRIRNKRNGIYQDEDARLYTVKQAQEVITYSAVTDYQPWMRQSELLIEQRDCGCNATNKFAGSDLSYPMASLVSLPQADAFGVAFQPTYLFVTPEVELEKVRDRSGSAYITYPVNKTTIQASYRNNQTELAKITTLIDSIKSDKEVEIMSVTFKGVSSPEGTYATNARLAEARALALKAYIDNLYAFPNSVVTATHEAEDWAGLAQWLQTSAMNDKEAILTIAQSEMEPDAKEQAISNRYPVQYRFLLENVYPTLRRCDYSIHYAVRSFTDMGRIAELLTTCPQKLSLSEIFAYTNTLDKSSPAYVDAFEVAAVMFPDNETANINAANVAMMSGDYSKAEKRLAKAGNSPQAIYAQGVLAAHTGKTDKAQALLQEAQRLGIAEATEALKQLENNNNK